ESAFLLCLFDLVTIVSPDHRALEATVIFLLYLLLSISSLFSESFDLFFRNRLCFINTKFGCVPIWVIFSHHVKIVEMVLTSWGTVEYRATTLLYNHGLDIRPYRWRGQ